jgi:hypothetical protein
MPKNLLFLSDKLPKPNYDKQFKSNQIIENNEKSYRSYNKPNNNNDDKKENEKNVNLVVKKPTKLVKLDHIPEEKEKEKEKDNENEKNNNSNHSDILNNKESNIQNLIQSNPEVINLGGAKSINPKVNIGLIKNKSSNNNNQIILKKEEKYYLDILSKQKNELRKLELKNNIINKRLNYINNNSQINNVSIKELNKILMPNLVNKSVPKKINNYNIIRNDYYIKNPPYLKNLADLEKYKKKNLNKLDYDYGNNINIKIINNKNVVLPKIPRRLSPINKYISLI